MKRALAALLALGLLLGGCRNPGSSMASASPTSDAPAAPVSSAVGPPCRTADLEVVIAGESGAGGHIGLDFEVRNKSLATCRLYGYFGLSLLTSEGKAGIAAQRSMRIFTASTGPPTSVLLPPNSSLLPTAPATGVPGFAAGHAHVAAAYSDVCDNTPSTTGNAWQLFPAGETVPMSVLTPGARAVTVCLLQVTPVQATPPAP